MTREHCTTPEKVPVAVWSGEIHGVKVHVLDDGRRIVDAESLGQLFSDIANGEDDDFDPTAFAIAFKKWTDEGTQ